MEDLNSIAIVGRLTRDAEYKSTANGGDLVKFSIAVNKSKKDGDNWIEVAHFFDVTYWGKRAKGVHPWLKKGQQVGIEGWLKQDRWEHEGLKRSRVSIEAKNVQLLGGGKKQDSNSTSQPTQQSPIDDEDVPF